MSHRRLTHCDGFRPFDGFIIIRAVVCLGPDGSSVYTNGIRISSRLDRRVERPALLTRHGLLAPALPNPPEFISDATHQPGRADESVEAVKRVLVGKNNNTLQIQVAHRI